MKVNVNVLLGKTLESVAVDTPYGDQVTFKTTDGEVFLMYHDQDCCEHVTLEDTTGDLKDLIGSPITMAEEAVSEGENPEGVVVPDYQDSFTWTFYKFATVKGYVTLRWYGESNGYYSESVKFEQTTP